MLLLGGRATGDLSGLPDVLRVQSVRAAGVKIREFLSHVVAPWNSFRVEVRSLVRWRLGTYLRCLRCSRSDLRPSLVNNISVREEDG